jgi:hypothetical protein
MTAQVLTLPVKTKKVVDEPVYYCLRCSGDNFKLHASGTVHCAGCNSPIRNLRIEGVGD